jgi:hypothetical protein
VPESVPGPKRRSGSFGKLERTWFQFETFEPGSQIAFNWATVRRRPVVLQVDDVRESVDSNLELDVLDAIRLASDFLFLVDLTRGIREIRLTGAEALETTAGARDPDGDVGAAGRPEVLGSFRHERPDRARAVRGNRPAATAVATAAARSHESEDGQGREKRNSITCGHAASVSGCQPRREA